jgi:hypothetical protein
MGEFTILTGETGSGKTTFLSQLSLDFLQQRIPTLWGSFEIKNDKLASLFLMQYAKKNLRQSNIEEIELYNDNFMKLPLYLLKFHGSQNFDEVITTMEQAIYNYNIQNIVLDNLQFMVGVPSRAVNRFDLQDEIIQKLRKLATDKNVHITLVIHPKKTDEALTISSIFGSAKASQEADNVFILQSLKGLRVIEVAKNRFDGSVGKNILGFDTRTCRFFEVTENEFEMVQQGKSKLNDIIEERIKQYGCVDFMFKSGEGKIIEMPGNIKEAMQIYKAKLDGVEFLKDNVVKDIKAEGREQTEVKVDAFGGDDEGVNKKVVNNESKLEELDETIKALDDEIKIADEVKVDDEFSKANELNLMVNGEIAIQHDTEEVIVDIEVIIADEIQVDNGIRGTQVDAESKTGIPDNVKDKRIQESDKSKIKIPRIFNMEKFTYLNDYKYTFSSISLFHRLLFPAISIIDNFHTEESLQMSKMISQNRSYKPNRPFKDKRENKFSDIFEINNN